MYDETEKNLLFYAKARYMKWHGFKVFTDTSMTHELLFAERIFGKKGVGFRENFKNTFNAYFHVTDSETGEFIGRFRRATLSSMFRDQWDILDKNDNVIGTIAERKGCQQILSRIFVFVRQHYSIEKNGTEIAQLDSRSTLFMAKYDYQIHDESVDKRFLTIAAFLICGMEGKQGANS